MLIREKDQFEVVARKDLLYRLIDGINYEAESHWVKLLSDCIGDDYVQHLMKMLEDYNGVKIGTIGVLSTTLVHINDCPIWIADISRKFHTFLYNPLVKITERFVNEYKQQYKNRTLTYLAAIVLIVLTIG